MRNSVTAPMCVRHAAEVIKTSTLPRGRNEDRLYDGLVCDPIILIPLFGVPVSGSLHVMAIDVAMRKLRKGERS